MSDFLKCECPHCGQNIEYPSEGKGQTVPCPTCEKLVTLTPTNPPAKFSSTVIPPTPATVAPVSAQKPKEQKPVRTNLSKLTEETIRAKTQTGDTPLHRAAKTGRISEIPRHLLKAELFMVTNNSFHPETPLHLAARYGQLDKVPPEFLTKETLTASTEYVKKESRTGPMPPRTMTPLHTAALYGHADQIPKEFLTTEEQIKSLEGGLKLDRKAGITASKLDELLKLEGQPLRAEDMQLFALYKIKFYTGDAFAAYAVGDLVRCFAKMFDESREYTDISMACVAASNDPAIHKATITLDQSGQLVFTWPKRKLEQWYRKGAKY